MRSASGGIAFGRDNLAAGLDSARSHGPDRFHGRADSGRAPANHQRSTCSRAQASSGPCRTSSARRFKPASSWMPTLAVGPSMRSPAVSGISLPSGGADPNLRHELTVKLPCAAPYLSGDPNPTDRLNESCTLAPPRGTLGSWRYFARSQNEPLRQEG
jgi:hypothetical protein